MEKIYLLAKATTATGSKGTIFDGSSTRPAALGDSPISVAFCNFSGLNTPVNTFRMKCVACFEEPIALHRTDSSQ